MSCKSQTVQLSRGIISSTSIMWRLSLSWVAGCVHAPSSHWAPHHATPHPTNPPCLASWRSAKSCHTSALFSLHSIFLLVSLCVTIIIIFSTFGLFRQAQTYSMMNAFNNLFSISGGGWGGANLEVSPWRERLSVHSCPEVMVLKWILATRAEVEIIGDACLVVALCFPSLPGCSAPLQEPCSASCAKSVQSLQSTLNATADKPRPSTSSLISCHYLTGVPFLLHLPSHLHDKTDSNCTKKGQILICGIRVRKKKITKKHQTKLTVISNQPDQPLFLLTFCFTDWLIQTFTISMPLCHKLCLVSDELVNTGQQV